jgi:hypothetical protein
VFSLKKFILGLTIGIAVSVSSVVYAADTIQAYLFKAHFYINGQIAKMDNEYATLNYNGHVYVPIRYVAENLGAYVEYDDSNQGITINHFPTNKIFLTDIKIPNVHVGNISAHLDGGATVIEGLMSVDSNQDITANHDLKFNLNFYDKENMLLGTFSWGSGNKQISNGEIRYFVDSVPGNVTNYEKIILKVTDYK